MKQLLLIFMTCCTFMSAQFTSPNNGTTYTLATLSAAAPAVLVKNTTDYTLTADLTLLRLTNLLSMKTQHLKSTLMLPFLSMANTKQRQKALL